MKPLSKREVFLLGVVWTVIWFVAGYVWVMAR